MHFPADGRIEFDNNASERAIRPIDLNRKNALFAGLDAGAEKWATVAHLDLQFNAVDPLNCLTVTLASIVDGHK